VGVVVAGAGVVGLGLSAVFALIAKGKYNDSLNGCQRGLGPNVCSQPAVTERDDARSAGDAATASLIAGGAAFATGAIVWLTAPRSHATPVGSAARVVVVPLLGGAAVRGTW
jgi:hypothetical protein